MVFPWIVPIGLFAAGLVAGSFLSAFSWRLPRRQPIGGRKTRSACSHCQAELTARDLIPLISYIAARGRCRHCDRSISPRYPLIEALTGAGFMIAYLTADDWARSLAGMVFVSFLLLMAVIDLEHMLLPDRINVVGGVAGVLFTVAGWTGISWSASVLGAVIGYGILFGVNRVSKGGMGLGDAKFLAAIGTFLGPFGTLVALFSGSLIGALIGGAMILSGRRRRDKPMPFGPFLAVGAFLFWSICIFPV